MTKASSEVEETRALNESASSLIISNFCQQKQQNKIKTIHTHIYTNIYKLTHAQQVAFGDFNLTLMD